MKADSILGSRRGFDIMVCYRKACSYTSLTPTGFRVTFKNEQHSSSSIINQRSSIPEHGTQSGHNIIPYHAVHWPGCLHLPI